MTTAYLVSPAPGGREAARISMDEFVETLRQRVLIPVIEARAARIRLDVSRQLPPAIDGREAARLWASAEERVAGLPAGSRLHVRVSAEADETHISITGSTGATIGALLATR